MPRPVARRLTDAQRDRVEANYYLVPWGISRIRRARPGITTDEARSLAGEALIHAVILHDPAKGKLSTYFCWRLRAALRDRDHFRRPKGYRHGRPGAPEFRRLVAADRDRISRRVDRDPDLAEEMAAVLAELTEAERELLRLRVVEGRHLDALGVSLGVSRFTVGVRLGKALQHAREALERRDNL